MEDSLSCNQRRGFLAPKFSFLAHLLNKLSCRAIEGSQEIRDLKKEVETFGSNFEMPGFEIGSKAVANGYH